MATTIYNPVTAAQLAGVGGGTAGQVMIGPFVTVNSASTVPGLGGYAGFNYGPVNNGSILAATLTIGSGTAGTGTIALTKNGTNIGTAFSSVSFPSAQPFKYYSVTFASGTYTFVNGDYLGFVVTAQSTGFTMTAFLNLSTF